MRLAALLLAAGLSTTALAACAFAQPAPSGPPPTADQGPPPGAYQGPPPGAMQGPPSGAMAPAPPHGMKAKFEAANTTHDGKLTLAQAEAAGLKRVAKHFSEIDRDGKGYVTIQDMKAWHQERKAEKAAAHGQAPAGGPPPQGAPPAGGPQY